MFDFIKRLFSGGETSVSYVNLSPTDFGQKIASNTEGVILDIRTAAEYQSGHLPKSINANVMSSELVSKSAKLDKSKPVFVYCRSGARSTTACKMLAKQGFSEVYNMSGGISSWTGKIIK